jgi:hypothetical protein
MAELKYPSSKEIDGPWMLSEDQLLNLDEILDNAKKGLRNSRSLEIAEAIARESNYSQLSEWESKDLGKRISQRSSFKRQKEEFTLFMPDGRKLVDSSIKGLLQHQELTHMRPDEFVAKVEFGDSNRLRIDLPLGFEYELRCFDPEIESAIKFEVDRWIDKNKPNRVLGWWEALAPLTAFFSGGAFVLIFLINLFPDDPDIWKHYSNDVLKPQAISVLEKGVDSSTSDLAVSILLQEKFKYVPKGYKPMGLENSDETVWDRQYEVLQWEVLSLALFLGAYFHPRPMMGIGNNKQRFARYKIWIAVLTVSIPATFIIAPLAEKIKDWLWG